MEEIHGTNLTVSEVKRVKSIIEWTLAACQYTKSDIEVLDSILYKLRSQIKDFELNESSPGKRK